MTIAIGQPELMTRPEAAHYLRLKEQTLAAMACAGRGPPYIKCGRSVRYRRADLEAYLQANTVTPGEPKE